MPARKTPKTNAMRIFDAEKIPYEVREYAYDPDDLDGRHAAEGVGLPYGCVFKTLVTCNTKNECFVFCLPVDSELDLKKAARAAGQKALSMLHVKDLPALTGYIRGGCSPIGMKKHFPVFIHQAAEQCELLAVSAGQRGVQLILSPQSLQDATHCEFFDLTEA